MSDVQRWQPEPRVSEDGIDIPVLVEDDNGQFVEYVTYDALAIERDRLHNTLDTTMQALEHACAKDDCGHSTRNWVVDASSGFGHCEMCVLREKLAAVVEAANNVATAWPRMDNDQLTAAMTALQATLAKAQEGT